MYEAVDTLQKPQKLSVEYTIEEKEMKRLTLTWYAACRDRYFKLPRDGYA